MKEILAPVSLGELIDKITILQIKKANLEGQPLINVEHELGQLIETLISLSLNIDQTTFEKLRKVNQDLWNIEDAIRDFEKAKNFGPDFIQLARSVYKTNDLRSTIKKEINAKYNSVIVEEKFYKEY
jgi:protein subunit release factor A